MFHAYDKTHVDCSICEELSKKVIVDECQIHPGETGQCLGKPPEKSERAGSFKDLLEFFGVKRDDHKPPG